MTDLLVDTWAALWLLADEPLRAGAEAQIDAAVLNGSKLAVSPISAWQVGQLVRKGRLPLPISPLEWYARLCALPDVQEVAVAAKVLVDSHFLPGIPPADPTDRISIATAREYGYRIVTRDAKILDYAAKGHVLALAC